MVLHTNSVRRPSGRADKINLIRTGTLNPFQKICYKVLFRNLAPSRGPRLCRPWLNRTDLHYKPLSYHKNWWICIPLKFGHFSKNSIFWKKMWKFFEKFDFQQKFNRLQIHQFLSYDDDLWCKSLLFYHANRLVYILWSRARLRAKISSIWIKKSQKNAFFDDIRAPPAHAHWRART